MVLPTLQIESSLWANGFKLVCGIDEVGKESASGIQITCAIGMLYQYEQILLGNPPYKFAEEFVEGFSMAQYKVDKYKTCKKDKCPTYELTHLEVIVEKESKEIAGEVTDIPVGLLPFLHLCPSSALRKAAGVGA